MKICVLTLSRSHECAECLYNLQDVGLGKAFAELGHATNVIRLEKRVSPDVVERYNNLLTISHFNVFAIGGNSIGIGKYLPSDIDVMILFMFLSPLQKPSGQAAICFAPKSPAFLN